MTTLLSAGHLDDFTLAALALGDLPAQLGAEAREHLYGCGGCRGRFAEVAVEADAHEGRLDAAPFGLRPSPAEPAPSVETLHFEPVARPAPLRLAEAARPDAGVILLFP